MTGLANPLIIGSHVKFGFLEGETDEVAVYGRTDSTGTGKNQRDDLLDCKTWY